MNDDDDNVITNQYRTLEAEEQEETLGAVGLRDRGHVLPQGHHLQKVVLKLSTWSETRK